MDGQQRRAEDTHGMTETIKRGRAAVKELQAAVRKKLRTSNPALYRVWVRASRIKSDPQPAEATPPSTPASTSSGATPSASAG